MTYTICTFPLHEGTLLRHWMVYSHVWPLSSHGCQRINWKWTQIKLKSFLSGKKRQRSKYLSMFPIELFSVETNRAKSAWNLGSNIWPKLTKISPSTHIYQQCAAPAFYHMWDPQRTHRYLDLDSAKVCATKSINQSNFYSANIPSKARLSGATAKSLIEQQNRGNSSVTSTGHGEWWYLWGKGQIKEMCLQIILEGSNWTGWTDRQWEIVPKRWGTRVKSSSTSIDLDPRDWQTIINIAPVSSHLDYCNSLLYGITDTKRIKLQRIQNRLGCLVPKSPPLTRSFPLLCSHHASKV